MLCRSSTTVGGGSILETQANGEAIKTLEECNVANGKTTNLDNRYGYWQPEDQGSCITCHNVHESLFVADAKEPLRRECTTCHTDKLINDMSHPLGAGTPYGEAGGEAAVACEICHMPKATSGGFPMHLWRINSSASYSTFPAHADNAAFNAGKKIANVAADGSYANAAWVELDYACGQCHGGDTNTTKPGLPHYDKATLAAFATGIHQGSSTNTAPTAAISGVTQTGYAVSFTDGSTDAETAQASLVVTVKWGDGGISTGSGGGSFSHTYATAGTFPIFLTAQDAGGLTGSATTSVAVPVKYSISGNVFQQDGVTGFAGANVYLKQNGITKSLLQTVDGTYSFPNVNAGTYQVQVYKTGMVFDGDNVTVGVQNPINVTVTSANVTRDFKRVATTITVLTRNGATNLDGATIYLKQNGGVVASGKTIAGAVAFTVVPGTYQVQASKAGYSFDGDSVAAGNQNPVTANAAANVIVPFTYTP
jgi:hypothetical protein